MPMPNVEEKAVYPALALEKVRKACLYGPPEEIAAISKEEVAAALEMDRKDNGYPWFGKLPEDVRTDPGVQKVLWRNYMQSNDYRRQKKFEEVMQNKREEVMQNKLEETMQKNLEEAMQKRLEEAMQKRLEETMQKKFEEAAVRRLEGNAPDWLVQAAGPSGGAPAEAGGPRFR